SAGFQPALSRQRLDAGTGPIPIIAGSIPVVANALILASGFNPNFSARSADITRTAAPPSLMPEALAAVTEPSLANAGFKPETESGVVPALMNSSAANATGSPLRWGIITGTISSLNLPAFCAASAL